MDDDARVGVMMVKSTATFRHAEKNTGCFKQGKAQRAAIQSNTGLLDQKFGFSFFFTCLWCYIYWRNNPFYDFNECEILLKVRRHGQRMAKPKKKKKHSELVGNIFLAR